MNGLDLLVVALAVGFGFYFGKDSYFTILVLEQWIPIRLYLVL